MTGAMVRYPKISHARHRMMSCTGSLYAAYSRYCDWIKVGFTLDLSTRLENLGGQYEGFGPFSLIDSAVSTWSAEQQLHRSLEPFRQHRKGRSKELYPACPSAVEAIKRIVACRRWDRMSVDEYLEMIRWTRATAAAPLNRAESNITYERYIQARNAQVIPSLPSSISG